MEPHGTKICICTRQIWVHTPDKRKYIDVAFKITISESGQIFRLEEIFSFDRRLPSGRNFGVGFHRRSDVRRRRSKLPIYFIFYFSKFPFLSRNLILDMESAVRERAIPSQFKVLESGKTCLTDFPLRRLKWIVFRLSCFSKLPTVCPAVIWWPCQAPAVPFLKYSLKNGACGGVTWIKSRSLELGKQGTELIF